MANLKSKSLWSLYLGISVFLLVTGAWHFYAKAHVPRFHVFIYKGDQPLELETAGKTVGEALKEQKISLRPEDVVVPSLSTPIQAAPPQEIGPGGSATTAGIGRAVAECLACPLHRAASPESACLRALA